MKIRSANCPGCGGPVEFKTASALVTVCDFCNSVVARGDKDVKDYGKVADVGETSSGLQIGATGKYRGKPFTITGRVRYQHPAGGFWDEWYLYLPGNKWGWLAEAQGRFYLFFEKRLKSDANLPPFDSLGIGSEVRIGSHAFHVREKGTATAYAADGEIPWDFHPNGDHHFVDLEGPEDTFATLEYGESPTAFVGTEVPLPELGVDTSLGHPDAEKTRVEAQKLNCPHCSGLLTLQVPDESLRVTCPNCDRLLDIKEGKLSVLEALKKRKVKPLLPMGREGTINGKKYMVIGFMERYATYEGKVFPWDEYLIYNREVGFRWLVCNQQHWSFVEPVRLNVMGSPPQLNYNKQSFRIYDRGTAYVRYVMGEFYWQVRVGETVQTADYIAPPQMLSLEWSFTTKSEELNVSLGTYMQAEEIEQAFGLKNIPRPWGVGTISPKPSFGWQFYALWGAFALILFVLYGAFAKPMGPGGADGWLMFYGLLAISTPPILSFFYLYSVEVQRWKDSDYSPYASGS